MSAIFCSRPAETRLVPFSYFCTCWNVRPIPSARLDWDRPRSSRSARILRPISTSSAPARRLRVAPSRELIKSCPRACPYVRRTISACRGGDFASENMCIRTISGENWLPRSSIAKRCAGPVAKLFGTGCCKNGAAHRGGAARTHFVGRSARLRRRRAHAELPQGRNRAAHQLSTVVRRMERLEETFRISAVRSACRMALRSPRKAAPSTRARSRWNAPAIRCARISTRISPHAAWCAARSPKGLGTLWILPHLAQFSRTHPTTIVDLRCSMEVADVLRMEADVAVQLEKPDGRM